TLDRGTRLALDRTRMAYERTLMAWIRTATALISFGFTTYKFLEFEQENRAVPVDRLLGPREFALVMIGIGLIALVASTLDHRRSLGALRAEYGTAVRAFSSAGIVAALVSLLGILSFLGVLLRQ